MQIYVAGSLNDARMVREVQAAVTAAGHGVTWDWTREADAGLSDYAGEPSTSARIAQADLEAVLDSDAVLVVIGEERGLGMFIEMGAALACAQRGQLEHVVLLGNNLTESVFYFHPAVRRFESVHDWLATV